VSSASRGRLGVAGNAVQLSVSEYVKTANAICSDAATKSAAVPKPGDTAALAQWAAYLSKLLPIANAEHDRLAHISPPPADRAKVDGFISAIAGANDSSERARQAAASGSQNGFDSALKTVGRFTAKATQVSRDYGLTQCAQTF